MAPITWPLTMMGSAPGCGKSFIKVGARFSPLRTILLVSEAGRRRADCRLQAIVGRRRILASQPDQTRPDQTRPDQTRQDQTRPDQNRPDQLYYTHRGYSIK